MEQKGNKFILIIIFMLLGTVLAVQFRSTVFANKQKTESGYKIDQLKAMLDEEKKVGEALKASIQKNERNWDNSLKNVIFSSENVQLKKLYDELDDAKLKAGLTDVRGPGIIIKLDDAPARINQDISQLIIHDADIKKILNEIKSAGAQAISINEERIISTSEPVCAGPTILINRNRYPVPYTIKVIGNADTLYKKIDESDRIGLMRRDGIRISIEKSKEIVINRYGNDDIDRLVSGVEVIGK